MKVRHMRRFAWGLGYVLLMFVGGVLLSSCANDGAGNSTDALVVRIAYEPVGDVSARSTVTFSGGDSSPGIPQSTISEIRYLWDFGDGATESGQSVAHVFDIPGEYEVVLTLEVIDTSNQFQRATESTNVVVIPPALGELEAVISYDDDSDWLTGQRIAFDASNSTVEGYDFSTLMDRQVMWTFGDGTPDSYGAQVSHSFEMPGEFLVTLNVSGVDSFGRKLQAESSRTVAARNRPPVVEAQILPVGTASRIRSEQPVNLLSSDSFDPEGQTLYVEWDIDGDNTVDIQRTSTLDQRYEHGFPATGEYAVQVRVYDQYMIDTGQPPETMTLFVQVGGGPLPPTDLSGFFLSGGLMLFGDLNLWKAQLGISLLEGNLAAFVGYGTSTDTLTIPMIGAFPAVGNAGYDISAYMSSANILSVSAMYQVYPSTYVGGSLGLLTCEGEYRASSRVTVGGQVSPIPFKEQRIIVGVEFGYQVGFGMVTFSVTLAL